MNKNKQVKYFLDSALFLKKAADGVEFEKDYLAMKQKLRNFSAATLFAKGKRIESFFTEDSKLYITPKEYELLKRRVVLDRGIKKWDSLNSRIVREYKRYVPRRKNAFHKYLLEKYALLNEKIAIGSENFAANFSIVKAWNISIVAAILFGMFTMTMIYRYLGQSASAEDGEMGATIQLAEVAVLGQEQTDDSSMILGDEANIEYIEQVIHNLEESEKEALEKKTLEMVKGYPIEEMIPYIMEKDRIVVAFLIGIAKKESNWGKRVPVLNGQDCYNYWGYRGKRQFMGTDGHTCFNSRKDAVDTVAKRIEGLVNNDKLNTPEKMIIWKCGFSCDGHSRYSVQKWISDVNMYFKKFND